MESTQTQPRYSVVRSYAGHSDWQGSDKDYAICLVHLTAAGDVSEEAEPDDAQTWMVLFVFGRPGRIQGGTPGPLMTRGAAEKEYDKKVKEKVGPHHYTPLPGLDFALYVRHFNRHYKVSLELPDATPSFAEETLRAEAPATAAPTADERYAGCPVTDISLERFWQCAESSRYGTEEKVDGERCPLSRAKPGLTAYNRNGAALSDLPEKAKALLRLSELPFLVDGERMVNSEQKGHYILFDLLEWREQDLRAWPYSQRIETLQQAMHAAGLIKEVCPTPTLQQAYENSTVSGLALLTPVTGREEVERLVAAIQQQGGEGMVVRDLDAPYLAARGAFKYKFTADMDAVVIGINQGAGGGSLELALRRPLDKDGNTDNAVIALGRVRAGLTVEDMRWFADQLAYGKLVVLKVRYRLKRTIGITLVEPSTSIDWVRTDKTPWECTTDQWGAEKADLVQNAPALFTGKGAERRRVSFEKPAPSNQATSQSSLW